MFNLKNLFRKAGKQLASGEVTRKPLIAGDSILFGRYVQHHHATGENERIDWIIVEIQGDQALLIANSGLDCQPYHKKEREQVSWETCSLRKWLNEDFLNAAFSKEERTAIATSVVSNEGHPTWRTKSYPDTRDAVFLPSIKEMQTYGLADFSPAITVYAQERGAKEDARNGAAWWLRSIGAPPYSAAYYFMHDARCYEGGMTDAEVAVCPMLRVRLSAVQRLGSYVEYRGSGAKWNAEDKDSFLVDVINLLLFVYQKLPEGYVYDPAQSGYPISLIVKMGGALKRLGGEKLLQQAKSVFAQSNPDLAQRENLAKLWA